MRAITSKLQGAAVIVVCVLLGAKFPSLVAAEKGVSVYGGLIGGCGAVFALLVASLISEPVRNIEATESKRRLLPMRAATLALLIAVIAVTAFLYAQYGWLLILVRAAVVVGAISVLAGLVMTSERGGNNV